MFYKKFYLLGSALLILTLLQHAITYQTAYAQEIYTLTGKVTNFAVGEPELKLYEYQNGAWKQLNNSPTITDLGNGEYSYTIEFEYSSDGGATIVTAAYESYSFTFEAVDCDHDAKTCTALDITPTLRTISGKAYKPNGKVWGAGLELNITIDSDGGSINTDNDGAYSFTAYDSQDVMINPLLTDGYVFKTVDESGLSKDPPWTASKPLGKDFTVNFESQGTRSISGQLYGSGSFNQCIVGVTITAEHSNAVQGSAVTDSLGQFVIKNLEPVNGYSVKVTYPNTNACEEYSFNDQDLTSSDLFLPIFLYGSSSITGKVMANMRVVTPQLVGSTYVNQYGPDNPTIPLAYYLLANYTTNRGFVYQTSVDWLTGSYRINDIPPFLTSGASGTLEISRVGGSAAFGYESGYSSSTSCNLSGFYTKSKCDLMDVGPVQEVRQDFLLTPNRQLSGAIVGQSVTPIQRGAIITFGEGLLWKSPGVLNNAGTAANNFAGSTSTAFTLLAQPRIYYLQPTEPGGLITGFASAGMNRKLANLTSTNSASNAFTVNLRTGTINGCLETEYGEVPVIPSNTNSLRLRPDTVPTGTTNTFGGIITLNSQNCSGYPEYIIPNVPYGVVGTFELDNHTVIGNSRRLADPFSDEIVIRKLVIQGDRSIAGKVYSAYNQSTGFLNPALNFDLGNNIALSSLAGVFTPTILTNDNLKEFEIPNLERKSYLLSYLGVIEGFDVTASTFAAPINIAANLTANSLVDIPLLAFHKPIDLPISPGTNISTDGYTHGSGPIMISWASPEANWQDPLFSYELQIGNIAKTAFTETNPSPLVISHDNTLDEIQVTYSSILPGQVYWYRIRPVFYFDKGPWSSATTNPADRLTSTGFSPTPGFGWRYFTTPPNLTSPANSASIGTATQATLAWVAIANAASLIPSPLIAYRVDYKSDSSPSYTSFCVNTTSRVITGLASGTYSWRVQAFKYTGTFNAGSCNDGTCTTGSCIDGNKFTEVAEERTFIKP